MAIGTANCRPAVFMPTEPISRDIHSEIVKMNAAGLSGRQIAAALGIGEGTVRKYKDKPVPDDNIEKYAKFRKERFEELAERFRTFIGDTKPVKAPKVKGRDPTKKVTVNDLHCPFHRADALAEFIRQNRDAAECWLAGDVFDMFGVSRYPKAGKKYSSVDEFQIGRSVVRALAENFPIVRYLRRGGNHEERLLKHLMSKGIEPDVLEYFRFQDQDFDNPMAKACIGLDNVFPIETTRIDEAEYFHIGQIGDIVLSHAEKYSSIPNKAVGDVIAWLKKKAEPMGIVKPFRVVGQAHTHMAGKTWNDFGVIGIEMGCMAKVPEYDAGPKLNGRVPVVGYTVFYQKDGVTDLNASNFIQL